MIIMKKFLPLIFISFLFLLFREKLFYAFLPFLLSLLLCLPLCRLSDKISKKTKIPRKLLGIILFCLAAVGLFFALRWLSQKLIGEVGELYGRLCENPYIITDFFENIRHRLSQTSGFLSTILESRGLEGISASLEVFISDFIRKLLSGIIEKFSVTALNIAKKVPSFLFFCLVFIMSSFYFVTDGEVIFGFLRSVIPKEYLPHIKKVIRSFKELTKKYLCASLALCTVTFVITYAGLLIVGCRYSLFLSLFISAVDFLPLLGTGVVLLPWSLFCFLNSDIRTAIILLVIFASATVVKQVAEPKILGKNLGLHPLASLASMYIGMRLFGFSGLFLGLLGAVGIKGILRSKSIDNKGRI